MPENRPHRASSGSLVVSLVAVVGVLAAAWSFPGRLGVVAQDASPVATPAAGFEVVLQDVAGAAVGTASFAEGDGAVTISIAVQGLPAGKHGVHIHAMGICDSAGEEPFSTAGPHYDPTGGAHGGPPSTGEVATPGGDPTVHGGDFGNLSVAADGTGTAEVTSSRFTLSPGSTSLFDEDGSALVIHAKTDDFVSQPAGDSGGRIACGVVAPPAEETAAPAASPSAVTVEGHVQTPEQVPFAEEMLGQLHLPDGFEISVYAQGLSNPRMMAFAPDGTLYVTEPAGNGVLGLRDTDADGVADESFPAASNLPYVHGILFHEGRVYLAGEKQVWSAAVRADGTFGQPEVVLDNLPDGDQHGRRTIAIGPDGMLYVSLGSSCNVCIESNKENATIVRANLDGSGREVFAKGLRNTIGWGWHPETGELWGWDHGSDFRGDDQPPEELNRVVEGANYGWPYCFGDRQADVYGPYQPQGATFEQYCANTEAPVVEYQAHSAPIGFVFYTADHFPADYQGDAFVAMHGSWNRAPATGYEVVRVVFENGEPVSAEPFVTGWLMEGGAAHFGRVAGLVVAPDGSLLISDDTNGVIYRVTYVGGA